MSALIAANDAPLPERVTIIDIVAPGQSNHHGTLFGGGALAMIDKFSFVLATRRSRRTIVTASIAKTDFFAPVLVGDIAEVSGAIVRQGNRSIEIEAELVAENMLTGERRTSLSSRLVMVAVGEEAPPKPDVIIDESEPLVDGEVRSVEIVFPGHANQEGILYGSTALNWLGRTALIVATRQVRKPVMMVASDKVDFTVPIMVGDIVEISAKLLGIEDGAISIEASLCVEKPNAYGRRRCARAHFVYATTDGKI